MNTAPPTLVELRDALAAFGRAHPEIALLEVFGSVARGEATPESDVDVAVRFAEAWRRGIEAFDYLDHLAVLKEELAVQLGRPVHLLDYEGVVDGRAANPVLHRAVQRDARFVYGTDHQAS